MYEIKTIMEATMNLSEHCRIGGSVYRAIIDGQVLAVKNTKEDVTEELNVLQKVNHANLVKLMGISSDHLEAFGFPMPPFVTPPSLKLIFPNQQ
ncbi:hypothetical protein L3X38_002602 [Prunus dulcis]|uniref:Protein kinase domain-containing protein n=1 Tax=Prunus dulcis TaxID=3755 RepID=A0AAD4WUB4_PRUDU|nr:hypothetical protein L3X38_002602 [Prunus dulcis]